MLELLDHVSRCHRLNRKPPARHITKAAYSGANTKGSFAAKLNGDQSKGLVTGRHERKLSSFVDVWWDGSEFRLRINSARKHVHHLLELESSEFAI